jgi:hypothetical protein
MAFNENVVVQWREWKERYHQDKEYFDHANEVRGNRQRVIGEIRTVFNNFLNGSITLEEFRSTFHHKTSTDWDYFGMKGMSGAMVLNKYVKHIPDKSVLSEHLRDALKCPNNAEDGRRKMEELSSFLETMMKKYKLKRFDLQPGRIPYFVSGFWHFQSSEEWPFYYTITRTIFGQNGIYELKPNPIEDYFQFRDIFLALKSELKVDSFELDYLCGWLDYRNIKKSDQSSPPPVSFPPTDVPDLVVEPEVSDIKHTQVQWMLAKIGKKMGYNIWIASNDRSKEYQNEALGLFSEKELPPLGLGENAQKIIQYIDVIWLKGTKHIIAAFEVEKSTSIYSGILRMSDLVIEAPNSIFPMYIVAPEEKLAKVKRELCRPTFRDLYLPERCRFFSDKSLSQHYASIMRFATDISAIDTLTSRADCSVMDK